MTTQPWTTKELAALRAGWAEGLRGRNLAAHIAIATGLPPRSVPSVSSAALRDGLRTGRTRAYDDAEVKLLVELRAKGLSFEVIAGEFFKAGYTDRTAEALRVALSRSGLAPKGPRRPMIEWTRAERQTLGRLRRKGMTWRQVAEALSAKGTHRTATACKVQAVAFRRRGGQT